MLNALISIFSLGALFVAAFGLGRPLLRWIGIVDADRLTTAALSTGLGLTAAGIILLALGVAEVLYLPLVGVLTMIACCWGLVEIVLLCLRSREPAAEEFFRPLNQWESFSDAPWPAPSGWLLLAVLTAATVACGVSLVGALTPAKDATLACQLGSVQRFLVENRIVGLVTPDRAARPLLIDMWYFWALALDGSMCVQLLHWGLGLLLALAAVALATPLLGRPWAWLAGSLVLLTPGVNQQVSVPEASIALAALSTLALAAWYQAVLHGGDRRWFVVAGLLAGGALGIHYSAVLLVVAVEITWTWAALRHTEQRRFLLQGGVIAGLIAVGTGVLFSLPALWSATDFPSLSSATPSLVAWPDHLGVVLLAAVPGVLVVRRLRGLAAVLSTALIYLVLAFVVGRDARLALPAVPVLSVAAVWVWMELGRLPRPARWIAAAAFAVMVASSAALLVN